ncbi:MAG: hypothetical protein QOI41_7366, partial [Myxococcales bacterium]|nr:hypothetical protein [Myxococcales bacterium]
MSEENGNPRSVKDSRAKDRQTAAARRQAKLVSSIEAGTERLSALADGQARSTEEVRATVESMVTAIDETATFAQ